jgi:tape measure domain-containing protein
MAGRFSIESVVSMVDKASGPMKAYSASVAGFSKKVQGQYSGVTAASNKFSGALRSGLSTVGVIGGFALVAAGFKKIVSEAANFEGSVANFTTLLGGSETAAKKLVSDLQLLGAETPFEFKDLADATQRLLGFGVATKDTVAPTLRMLGDLAQGNSEKLQGISLVYGQIMAGGKMMGQDFNQLINQGVPIAQGLAKVWGVDVNEAIKRVKQNGPVMAKDVQAAMEQMTAAGGMFYGGMMRSSKTLTGLWSTFQDAISMTAAGIGVELLPIMKDFIISMTESASSVLKFTQNHKQGIGIVIKIIWAMRWALLAIIPLWIMYQMYLGIVAVKKMYLAAKTAILTAVTWLSAPAFTAEQLAMMSTSQAAHLCGVSKARLMFISIKHRIVTIAGTIAQWAAVAATWAWVAVSMVAAGVTWAFGAAVAFLTSPIGLIVLAIVALIAIGVLLYRNWDVVKEKMTAAWNYIKEGVFALGRGIMTAILNPVNLVMTAITSLLDAASSIPGIGDKFAAAAETIRGFQATMNETTGATNLVEVVKGAVTTAPGGGTPAVQPTATRAGGFMGRVSGFASPNSAGMVAGVNNTTTGNLNINVTTPKDAATVEKTGVMPKALRLNMGEAN